MLKNNQDIIQFANNRSSSLMQSITKKVYYYEFGYNHLELYEFRALALLAVQQPSHLCNLLHISFHKLEKILHNPKYAEFYILKKNKSGRRIHAPNKNLKLLQRRLNLYLQAWYSCIRPKISNGFTKNYKKGKYNCNIYSNAMPHRHKKHVLNIDLKDFFSSINAKTIYQLFTSSLFRFKPEIAKILTLLTTHKGMLPTGAPTSPVLSNFFCYNLDLALWQHCKKNQINYSRFADDFTFSANKYFTIQQVEGIKAIIQQNRFVINPEKIRLHSSAKRQLVTGLVVNNKVNVNRKFIRKIRAVLHDAEFHGIAKAAATYFKETHADEMLQNKFMNSISGGIAFVGQIRGFDDVIYKRYKNKLEWVAIKNNRIENM